MGTETSMAGPGFMGLGASPQGGMSPMTQALMMFGTGLLSGDPRTQGLARGFQGVAQAYSPQAAMQRQIMQGQVDELQRRRAQDEAFENFVLGLPQSGMTAEAPVSMAEPALGGSLVDIPGGGTEPGQVQTAMTAPAPAPQPAGQPTLPQGVTPELLAALGPRHPLTQSILAQMYKPQAAPKPTSAMKNAEALGYKPGTPEFEEYVRAATLPGAGVQITMPRQMGPIPPGYRATYDDQGRPVSIEPIPGSPAAREVAETAERKAGQEAAEAENVRFLTDQIDTAISQAKGEGAILPTTGLLAPVTSAIGGTTSSDLSATLETIGANISFNRLNTMRQNSKTGAGLGNVTERELDLLKNSAGSLRQTQSMEQLVKNLENHKRLLNRIVNRGMTDAEVNEELRKMGAMGAGVTIGITPDLENRLANDPSSLTDEELDALEQ